MALQNQLITRDKILIFTPPQPIAFRLTGLLHYSYPTLRQPRCRLRVLHHLLIRHPRQLPLLGFLPLHFVPPCSVLLPYSVLHFVQSTATKDNKINQQSNTTDKQFTVYHKSKIRYYVVN